MYTYGPFYEVWMDIRDIRPMTIDEQNQGLTTDMGMNQRDLEEGVGIEPYSEGSMLKRRAEESEAVTKIYSKLNYLRKLSFAR